MRFSGVTRRISAAALAVLTIGVCGSLAPSTSVAATSPHTDVMFVFDTTGSMGGALNEAQEQIQEAMTLIAGTVPDPQFGLAEMRDYSEVNNPGFFEYDIGSGFQPWTLNVPITSNQAAVASGIGSLFATGGGDGPEAYGRALYETDVNPAVGWRPGARGVIILVADNVPHDNELNDGIPSSVWYTSPFDTGQDPGADNTVGNGDDLDWQGVVLPKLISDGRPLEYVDYFGEPGYFPYWQNWTGRTGGSALEATGINLAAQIAQLVKAGVDAPLPLCPAGQGRDASGHCVAASFKIEPRISCAGVCHVVLVKIVFDVAGNVVAESVLDEARPSAVLGSQSRPKGKKHKKPALIKRLSKAVKVGSNTLRLKLTSAAQKTLQKKKRLKLKVKITYTPDGGSPTAKVHTFTVKLPAKHKKRHHATR